MHYLYVLKSVHCNRHYIGITGSVSKRLSRHNAGGVKSTRAYKPWKVVHIEAFNSKYEARKKELYLKKTARARKELFDRIS